MPSPDATTTSAKIRTVQYVMIDTSPLDDIDRLIPEYASLPVRFHIALVNITNLVDSSECSNCENGVGYIVHDDDDYPERNGVRWHATWLASSDDGPVKALCEDCAPVDIS